MRVVRGVLNFFFSRFVIHSPEQIQNEVEGVG